MKKFLALITAFAVLTALCACAEKIREISPDEARELANGALILDAVLEGGSRNVLGGEILSENGVEYAPAENLEYSSWSGFEKAVRGVYTEELAGEILSSGKCLEKDGATYLKYIPSEGENGYSALSFGAVEIDGDSNSKSASGVLEISSTDGSETLNIEYLNTPDGWRIAGIGE